MAPENSRSVELLGRPLGVGALLGVFIFLLAQVNAEEQQPLHVDESIYEIPQNESNIIGDSTVNSVAKEAMYVLHMTSHVCDVCYGNIVELLDQLHENDFEIRVLLIADSKTEANQIRRASSIGKFIIDREDISYKNVFSKWGNEYSPDPILNKVQKHEMKIVQKVRIRNLSYPEGFLMNLILEND